MHLRRAMSRALAVVVTVALTSTLAVTLASPPGVARTRCAPAPVAHRGDSARAPENTLPAVRRALRLGVRQIEVDVRFTANDVPVLLHDETVNRTTDGRGPVSAMSLAKLRSLDAGSWFARRYRDVRVPTLYQVLDYGRTRRASFLVELKTRPTAAQMAALLARFRWLGMTPRVQVTSFDRATLTDVRAAAPGLRTALIDQPRYRRPASVLRYGRTYLVHHDSVTDRRARRWRAAGIEIRPWTVDTARQWRRMARDGATAVITNRPRSYLAWARAYCR